MEGRGVFFKESEAYVYEKEKSGFFVHAAVSKIGRAHV